MLLLLKKCPTNNKVFAVFELLQRHYYDSRSKGARFRIVQYVSGDHWYSWAVDKAYMGPACPLHCRGNGECWNGKCR